MLTHFRVLAYKVTSYICTRVQKVHLYTGVNSMNISSLTTHKELQQVKFMPYWAMACVFNFNQCYSIKHKHCVDKMDNSFFMEYCSILQMIYPCTLLLFF